MLLTAFLVVYMAVISRACGGWFKLPGENFFYALPYILPVSFLGHNFITQAILICLCLIGATIGKGQANRVFMDLGIWRGPERKPHNYEKIIGWLKPHLGGFLYDFFGLALVGLAPALVPAIVVGIHNPIAGLILAIGGVFKPIGYFIGQVTFPRYFTQIGEFLTGVFAGLSIGFCVYLI